MRLISLGIVVFPETCQYLRVHKPSNVTTDEVKNTCTNVAKSCNLMDSMFSAMHSKRDAITSAIINALNSDLNLL